MHLPRRLAFCLAAVLTSSVGAAVPASAVEHGDGPVPAAAVPAADRAVTLITGDTAMVTTSADGTPRVVMLSSGERRTAFTTLRDGTDLYVVPDSVKRLVPDTLDPELFNVTGLLAQGYGDAETDSLPVIVQGAATALSAGADTHTLESIGATATRLPKKAGLVTTLAAGRKVWLDRRVTARDLDANLTQIGAPAAWDAGLSGAGVTVAVLDTGVDTEHPDLRGKVVAEANFTGDASAADGHGHGTHVASVIGGTGAAADGARKGVAYGAALLSGKVLGADGTGQLSWAIEGMEWAAGHGADVVNLSLGGNAPNGDDPAALALDRLAEETGTLFVVAAGNAGPGSSSVGTPGIARDALTVGAAGATGEHAYFSSRGPTRTTYRAKPDITAPGVNITGAAAGTTGYARMTGTSQATPHVAGAAALLRERHPDWDWRRIKTTLMTTADAKWATPAPYDEGAGLLDLPGALSETLRVDRGNADFGYLRSGEADGPRSITLTIANDGDTAEALTLTDQVRSRQGEPAADDVVTIAPAEVTIAPGASEQVTVTLNPPGTAYGVYSGAVTIARQGKQPTRMPLGFYYEAPRRDVTLTVLDRRGEPFANGTVVLGNMAELHPVTGGGYTTVRLDEHGTGVARVAPGPVSAMAKIVTPASGDTPETTTFAGTPELLVDSDMSYTIDARKAKRLEPLRIDGARAATLSTVSVHYARQDALGKGSVGDAIFATGEQLARGQVFVQPTAPVAHGRVTFETRWELANGDDRYSVVAGAPTVPDPPAYRATAHSFARIEADYRALGGQPDDYLTYRSPTTELVYATSGATYPLPAPTRRTEWVTADAGVRWRQCVSGPRQNVALLCEPGRTYRQGERTTAVWFRGPAPAVTAATHGNTRISLPVSLSDGMHEGQVRNTAAAGNQTLRLWRDGVEMPRVSANSSYFDTPPEPGMFRLEHTSAPDPGLLPIGTRTATTWTFPSAAPSEGTASSTTPRLLALDYQPATDSLGRLRAWRIPDFGLRVTSTAGRDGFRLEPGTLRFWASTDGGDHWHPGTVLPRFDGTYRVLVPTLVPRPGQHVSVRAAATAAQGRSIEQTLVDAYPVH